MPRDWEEPTTPVPYPIMNPLNEDQKKVFAEEWAKKRAHEQEVRWDAAINNLKKEYSILALLYPQSAPRMIQIYSKQRMESMMIYFEGAAKKYAARTDKHLRLSAEHAGNTMNALSFLMRDKQFLEEFHKSYVWHYRNWVGPNKPAPKDDDIPESLRLVTDPETMDRKRAENAEERKKKEQRDRETQKTQVSNNESMVEQPQSSPIEQAQNSTIEQPQGSTAQNNNPMMMQSQKRGRPIALAAVDGESSTKHRKQNNNEPQMHADRAAYLLTRVVTTPLADKEESISQVPATRYAATGANSVPVPQRIPAITEVAQNAPTADASTNVSLPIRLGPFVNTNPPSRAASDSAHRAVARSTSIVPHTTRNPANEEQSQPAVYRPYTETTHPSAELEEYGLNQQEVKQEAAAASLGYCIYLERIGVPMRIRKWAGEPSLEVKLETYRDLDLACTKSRDNEVLEVVLDLNEISTYTTSDLVRKLGDRVTVFKLRRTPCAAGLKQLLRGKLHRDETALIAISSNWAVVVVGTGDEVGDGHGSDGVPWHFVNEPYEPEDDFYQTFRRSTRRDPRRLH